jgi:hypothetical protein
MKIEEIHGAGKDKYMMQDIGYKAANALAKVMLKKNYNSCTKE